jgi:cytochrome c2
MKSRFVCSAMVAAPSLIFAGCQSNLSSSAPPVTASFLRAAKREQVDTTTLTRGRTVLLNRCIQCHAVPNVARFDPPSLTAIVGKMSGRANLSAEQHEAVLKYLLAVRSSL